MSLPKLELPKNFDRRTLIGGGAAAAVLALLGGVWLFQSPAESELTRRGKGGRAMGDVTQPNGELPEIVIGNPDAKVTIIEYASMTCPHCAAFHKNVLPQLKAKYIDPGKVKLVFREFPLDNLAIAASMVARCTGGAGPAALISDLFQRQEDWAFVRGDATPKLFDIAKQAGFTKDSFDKCRSDKTLRQKIVAIRAKASEQFGVNSTPTFFINGKRLAGGGSVADFDKALAPLLSS